MITVELRKLVNIGKTLLVKKVLSIRFFCLGILLVFTIGIFSCKENVNKKNIQRKELITKIKKLYYKDQKYRRILAMLEEYECIPDSVNMPRLDNKTILARKIILHEILKPLDRKNTEKLIEITKKYGFPGMDYLHHDIPIFMIFVHSEKKYHQEIKKLILEEFEKGRISEFEKDYILWHLKNRNGMLPGIPYPINYRKDIEIFKGSIDR